MDTNDSGAKDASEALLKSISMGRAGDIEAQLNAGAKMEEVDAVRHIKSCHCLLLSDL